MGKKGPLWWRESDWLLRGSSAANQILLRHSGPILWFLLYVKRKKQSLHQMCSIVPVASKGGSDKPP